MRELITKSELIRSTLTRDDLEEIAAGKWSEYPESKGALTDAEISTAKKLLENDAELFKSLDAQSNGSLNAYELLMGNRSLL